MELDDPALEPDHGGVGSVRRPVWKDVPNLALHRVLARSARDLFVGIPSAIRRNTRPGGASSVACWRVEGDLGDMDFAGAHGSNGGEEFLVQTVRADMPAHRIKCPARTSPA